MTVAMELARCKLDFVGLQWVRWCKGGIIRAGDYIFSMVTEMKIVCWEQDFFCTSGNSISS
jgi:hypothetical protein